MMGCKFHSILLKNGRENSTETGLLAKKYAKLVKRIWQLINVTLYGSLLLNFNNKPLGSWDLVNVEAWIKIIHTQDDSFQLETVEGMLLSHQSQPVELERKRVRHDLPKTIQNKHKKAVKVSLTFFIRKMTTLSLKIIILECTYTYRWQHSILADYIYIFFPGAKIIF